MLFCLLLVIITFYYLNIRVVSHFFPKKDVFKIFKSLIAVIILLSVWYFYLLYWYKSISIAPLSNKENFYLCDARKVYSHQRCDWLCEEKRWRKKFDDIVQNSFRWWSYSMVFAKIWHVIKFNLWSFSSACIYYTKIIQ